MESCSAPVLTGNVCRAIKLLINKMSRLLSQTNYVFYVINCVSCITWWGGRCSLAMKKTVAKQPRPEGISRGGVSSIRGQVFISAMPLLFELTIRLTLTLASKS